ncbi:aldo/keto reductase [Pseudomonas asuensis]|uniref:Oxidoreductase n=1 Tax=Pseudomonas asuensis TaxID=1825787 RepID=A0ABQ2H108_9PSED|nr:aldo/keto reductase [Pseudomonas asuensis]GGM24948.1 oxidoreductase [Pseudomonas asuensis]
MKTVRLPDGTAVPALGQGTWHMGEQASERAQEIRALRRGLELGMTLIDTAEMYAEGGAESVVGEAIYGQRDSVFLVSKVYPHNASRGGVLQACERSLKRLGTDRIDLYLLHWRGGTSLSETVDAFEALREQGKILHWGVSNFDVDDMLELADDRCASNQVLYNLEERSIEFDLLPWCQRQQMPLMAYCPIGQGGSMLRHPALFTVAERLGATPAQVALAWVLRQPGVIAIPKAVRLDHIELNAKSAVLQLSEHDLALLDAAFPPPQRKQRLAMV